MIALRAWLVLLCAVPLLLRATEAPVQLAWRTTQGYELVSLDRQRVERRPLPADLQAPLGSLWKLFVFAWLSDTGQAEPPYTCQAQPRGGLLLREWPDDRS